jgi:hypothetical protein
VAAALLCVGSALTPKGLDQLITTTATAAKVLPIAAAHTRQLYISNLLLLFGLGALGVSFAAIATLVRDRGATAATAAAVVGGFGCFCGALGNVLPGFNLAATVSAHTPPAAAQHYLVTTFTSTVGRMLIVGYLLGMLTGALVIAVALWRSRLVPRWLPLVFAIGLAVATFAPAGIASVPLQLPFAAAMVLLAFHIWRTAGTPGEHELRTIDALTSRP